MSNSHNDVVFYFVNIPSSAAAEAVNRELLNLHVCNDWDGEPLTVESGDDFVDGYARNLASDRLAALHALAVEHGFRFAVQFDYSMELEGGPIAGLVVWFDGPAG